MRSKQAANRSVPSINRQEADSIGQVTVRYNGRTTTFAEVSRTFLSTVYGKEEYKGLTAVQVAYGWLHRPDAWKSEHMIRINDAALRQRLAIDGGYASLEELFDDSLHYRLDTLGSYLPGHMGKLLRESPAVVELDEKVGLIISLTQGQLFHN